MARLTTLKPRVQVQPGRLATLPKPSAAPTYRIRGRTLQTIRAEHFRRNPLCVMCLDQGKVSIAVELDHILALTNGGKDEPDNRQGLCHPCHESKTLADLGIKSDAFTYRGPLWRLAERAP